MAMTRQVKHLQPSRTEACPARARLVSHFQRSRFRWILLFLLVPALACGFGVSGMAAPVTAQEILRGVRLNQSSQHRVLDGRLRHGRQTVPFRLVLDGQEIRYEFPDQALVLRLGESGSQLLEATRGGTQRVSPARFDAPVQGTDITYEDLALNFLYWPRAKIEGEETRLTRRCWKLHLEPASRGESQYAVVLLWVEQQSGAFLQAEGYDSNGKAAKRFKVVSGQRDPETGGWMLKSMRIEKLQGLRSKDASPTYLEITK